MKYPTKESKRDEVSLLKKALVRCTQEIADTSDPEKIEELRNEQNALFEWILDISLPLYFLNKKLQEKLS